MDAMAKNRLRWRATRRGMLELDEAFSRFLDQKYEGLSPEEQALFELLLEEQDPTLYAWILGFEEPPAQFIALVEKIR